jgi:hypothetical protein
MLYNLKSMTKLLKFTISVVGFGNTLIFALVYSPIPSQSQIGSYFTLIVVESLTLSDTKKV